ncbi:MAG: M14 family zinc carboxypeptidase [Chloroflexota bacterium]
MRLPLRAPSTLRVLALGAAALATVAALAVPAHAAAAEPDWPASNAGYHNWPELVGEIKQAAIDHPDIVTVFSIGKSFQGRDIWMAKISDNVNVEEGEPEVLIDALHHAREHLTTEQALAVLRWMTTGYGKDATITRLVDERVTWIVFALNPDGMRFDLTGTPYRAWRKNRQVTATGVPIYTDLNRNYGYHFGCCGGSSGNRSAINYRGPRAWSAPEVRALRDFVLGRVIGGVQMIRTHVTLHTNGELILWPYGYTMTNVPYDMTALDHNVFATLGKAMAARNGYKAEQSSDMYITDGDQIDWLYGVQRIFSYTYELYPAEQATVWRDHYPDDSRIGAQTARNRSAILLLIDQAACPYAILGSATAKLDCGPLFDDLEINRGWTVNAAATDTATSGAWEQADPAATSDGSGPKQAGTANSGYKDLVTGAAAGAGAGANDVDGGATTIRSRAITLPAAPAAFGPLTFRYTFAHDAAATAEDAFRAYVEAQDGTLTPVFEQPGDAVNRDATWSTASADVSAWAGQQIHLVFEAVDGGADNLVEAAVDDIRIRLP